MISDASVHVIILLSDFKFNNSLHLHLQCNVVRALSLSGSRAYHVAITEWRMHRSHLTLLYVYKWYTHRLNPQSVAYSTYIQMYIRKPVISMAVWFCVRLHWRCQIDALVFCVHSEFKNKISLQIRNPKVSSSSESISVHDIMLHRIFKSNRKNHSQLIMYSILSQVATL